ncbi:MAG: phospho-N-acetylmuramoyl-pentapeptide-transferase [Alphaproteobacteria bacterium]|jgi:phospho-N-acetylmuramoyl-pentapeptide-transferase|tara:strand:- start:2618 stop:3691 length:1074 start_codon:yes stop_codon:yes gene_type:complete
MLSDFLFSFNDINIFFNLFGYISFRAGISLIFSFIIVFLLMPKWINLQKNIFPKGQPIRTDGPSSHVIKEGTPALGGVLILLSIVINTILWTNNFSKFNYLVILSIILFGFLGFTDDYLKIKFRKGISSKLKFFIQILITFFLLYLINQYIINLTSLYLPFFKSFSLELGYFYIIFAIFVIIGSTNATNLTDGLDGLVSMPLIFVFLTFAVFSYIIGNSIYSDYLLLNFVPSSGELVIVCTASIGALLAFLWYNSYPAEVFMGDTGSQSLGGSLAIISILLKQEFVLAIAGGLFVIEALSVSIQVIFFKFTKKRFFLMAPLHHHYEKKGIPEQKIVIRFWIISFIFCLIALSLLKIR